MSFFDASAIIVTRGGLDLSEIISTLDGTRSRYHLPFAEIIIWDNSVEQDLAVYGRYAAIERARHDIIFVQDDDCLLDTRSIAEAYEPGRLVANMPKSRWDDYPDSTLVGWGAVFDARLPDDAWRKFNDRSVFAPTFTHESFYRTCDVVFSALTPRTVIDVGFKHLPWAEDPARAMFKQRGHKEERDTMLDLCRQIRNWDDDDRRVG